MGFFSFITQDTQRSISNRYNQHNVTPRVYMTDNKGNKWEEHWYEGYGEFGGKDFYELVAEMNGKTTRSEGISLAYQENQEGILYPNLTEASDWVWRNEKPESCPCQGYFY